jgi:hypothetical protein
MSKREQFFALAARDAWIRNVDPPCGVCALAGIFTMGVFSMLVC